MLALFFQVNVFDQAMKLGGQKSVNKALVTDSRTAIYIDVFNELNTTSRLLFGLGPGGKTKTFLSDSKSFDLSDFYKEGRRKTESGMLNMVQYGGLLGGSIYLLLFMAGSYRAISNSQNTFGKMVGVWLAFKGVFSFIEDSLWFSLASFTIFVGIGFAFSRNLLKMNDFEMRDLLSQTLTFRTKRTE